jgi:hypothetical protein
MRPRFGEPAEVALELRVELSERQRLSRGTNGALGIAQFATGRVFVHTADDLTVLEAERQAPALPIELRLRRLLAFSERLDVNRREAVGVEEHGPSFGTLKRPTIHAFTASAQRDERSVIRQDQLLHGSPCEPTGRDLQRIQRQLNGRSRSGIDLRRCWRRFRRRLGLCRYRASIRAIRVSPVGRITAADDDERQCNGNGQRTVANH